MASAENDSEQCSPFFFFFFYGPNNDLWYVSCEIVEYLREAKTKIITYNPHETKWTI